MLTVSCNSVHVESNSEKREGLLVNEIDGNIFLWTEPLTFDELHNIIIVMDTK